jgi:hypothetical protein
MLHDFFGQKIVIYIRLLHGAEGHSDNRNRHMSIRSRVRIWLRALGNNETLLCTLTSCVLSVPHV